MALTKLALKYVAERERRGEISHQTALDTRRTLLRFTAPIDHVTLDRLRARHVQRHLETGDLSPGSRYQAFAKIRCFCRWLALNRHTKIDICAGVKPPKVPKSAPRRLNHTDARDVMRACPDDRARVVVLLMLQEGLRCAEVAAVQMGDLDIIDRTLAVRGKGGAGGVTRHIALTTETARAIEVYLLDHPASAGPLIRSYLNPARGISAHYLTQMVARWMTDAGVKRAAWDGKSAHACRHTMASDMAERGASILEIQRALGHDNLSSTQIYLKGVTPNMRAAMEGRTYFGVHGSERESSR